jgi:hypothetical protein
MKRQSTKIRGYVRPMPRISASGQRAALIAYGVPETSIYEEGKDAEGLDALTRALRAGEAVAVVHLHLLAPPKRKTSDRPRRDLWKGIAAIEGKDSHIIEVGSGRSTSNKLERDDMIADAIEALTHSGRSPRRKDKGGRPPLDFTDAEIEAARREWYDLRHRTNADALKAIRAAIKVLRKDAPMWTMSRCYRSEHGFGPSGRGKS